VSGAPLRAKRITENGNSISPQRATSLPGSAIVSHSHARRGQDVICDHVDDVRPKVDRARCGSLVKKAVVNRVSDAGLEVPIMLPADSAMAFDDPSACDGDICGGVFSVESGYRPNLEFERAIRPAPAVLPSA
jgi:hypothetical protein